MGGSGRKILWKYISITDSTLHLLWSKLSNLIHNFAFAHVNLLYNFILCSGMKINEMKWKLKIISGTSAKCQYIVI